MTDRTRILSETLAFLSREDASSAYQTLEPLLDDLATDVNVAHVWAVLIAYFPDPQTLQTELDRLREVWAEDPRVMLPAALAAVRWCRRFPLALPNVREPLAESGAACVRRCLELQHGAKYDRDMRGALHLALAEVLVELGPKADAEALEAFEVAIQTNGELEAAWMALSRLHLRRGRYEKARDANLEALKHGQSPASYWNLALCQTILGDGQAAAAAWLAVNHEAWVTREGEAVVKGLERVELYLSSQTPRLWEGVPEVSDRPSYDEVVWVRPLSPGHGRIVSATRKDLAADFDDVVLWDGRPVDFRHTRDKDIPRFRALVVLRPGRAAVRRVRGQLPEVQSLDALNAALPEGCLLHPFGEVEAGPYEGKLVWPKSEEAEQIWQRVQQVAQGLGVVIEAVPAGEG